MRRLSLPLAILTSILLAASACSKPSDSADHDKNEDDDNDQPSKAEAAKTESSTPAERQAQPTQVADPNEACAKILVVAHDELESKELPEGAPLGRDKAAAKKKAEALLAQLRDGDSLVTLVKSDSNDARTRAKQGGMGTFKRDAWPARYKVFIEPTFALAIGEYSDVLDTPFGFSIVERCPINKVHSRHILIRYSGAKRADNDVKRSRKVAKAEAKALRTAIAGGQDFGTVAKENGEDGSAERGGDLGSIGRGMFAHPYEAAAWALKPGELSEVIETDFGFHIIERLAD